MFKFRCGVEAAFGEEKWSPQSIGAHAGAGNGYRRMQGRSTLGKGLDAMNARHQRLGLGNDGCIRGMHPPRSLREAPEDLLSGSSSCTRTSACFLGARSMPSVGGAGFAQAYRVLVHKQQSYMVCRLHSLAGLRAGEARRCQYTRHSSKVHAHPGRFRRCAGHCR